MTKVRSKKGCRSCYIAFMKDDKTFEKPEPIEGLQELSYSYTNAEGKAFADNILQIYEKKPVFAEITLTFLDIPTKLVSKMLGKKYVKGGTTTNTEDKAAPAAILFQEVYNDETYINTVFYNSTFARDENDAKTQEDNIEYQSLALTGTALPFTNAVVKNEIDFRMDSAAPDIDQEKLNKFFEEVQYIGTPTANAKNGEEPQDKEIINIQENKEDEGKEIKSKKSKPADEKLNIEKAKE